MTVVKLPNTKKSTAVNRRDNVEELGLLLPPPPPPRRAPDSE